MSGLLLDTNTVSELVSVKSSQRVVDWIEASDESQLFLSVTLGEIRQGVAALPKVRSARRSKRGWKSICSLRFAGRPAGRWSCCGPLGLAHG